MNLADPLDSLSSPLLQAVTGTVCGLLCLYSRRHRVGTGIVALAVFWLWLCSTPNFAIQLQDNLEGQYPARSLGSLPKADAIVILGGGALPRAKQAWRNGDAYSQNTRLGVGVQLYREARAPIIVLSGGNHEAKRMAGIVQQQGIPATVLLTEETSTSTHQNALYSAALLRGAQLHGVILVTSAMHMPRAMASFRQAGLLATPAAAFDSAAEFPPMSPSWWPRVEALKLSKRCLREYLGLWSYKLLGWA